MVVINLTPRQNYYGQAFRVVLDCLQFSGKGSGYLSDMLKKRIVLEPDDITENLTQVQVELPISGSYTIMARVLGENNEILQKFIVGSFPMEATDPEGSPPSLSINASSTSITVGDYLDLTADVSDPDGDNVELIWDFDHRNGIFFDSDVEAPSTRYIKPGNITVTCIVMDGEHTVVKTIEIKVEPAVGNDPPEAGMTSTVYEWGEVTLRASDLSMDPDGDELEYKFNFGDGNWTDWIEVGSADHQFSDTGVYNCSVRVRDTKGAVSERSFLIVTIDSVSNKPDDKEGDDDPSDTGSILVTVGIIAAISIILAGMILVTFLMIKRKKKINGEEEVMKW